MRWVHRYAPELEELLWAYQGYGSTSWRVDETYARQCKLLKANADGSVDVYFGPKAPAGQEGNWIQTVPGKG
jgi:hypothetical protein